MVARISVQYPRKNNQLPAITINKKQPSRAPTFITGATPIRRIESRYWLETNAIKLMINGTNSALAVAFRRTPSLAKDISNASVIET
jgi:hypothetical protein